MLSTPECWHDVATSDDKCQYQLEERCGCWGAVIGWESMLGRYYRAAETRHDYWRHSTYLYRRAVIGWMSWRAMSRQPAWHCYVIQHNGMTLSCHVAWQHDVEAAHRRCCFRSFVVGQCHRETSLFNLCWTFGRGGRRGWGARGDSMTPMI